MSLDIWVTAVAPLSGAFSGEPALSLDNDGYYWFLAEHFPVSSANGKPIDLYGDAIYRGDFLRTLVDSLGRARSAALEMPKVFDVSIGYRIAPERGPVPSQVERHKLLVIIDQLASAANTALEQGLTLVFSGD